MAMTVLASRLLADPRFRRFASTLAPLAVRQAVRLARHGQWRQLAILHADRVRSGAFSSEHLGGELHWVTWSANEPVGVYPPISGDLAGALRHVEPARRRSPQELPSRRARDSARERGRDVSRRLRRRPRSDQPERD